MDRRKNVLLILSDQQRLDTIGAYRQVGAGSFGMSHQADICCTPQIDALAEQGTTFRNAFTSSAICAQARASLMTGLFPHKHGVIDNFTDIKPGTPLLSRLLLLPSVIPSIRVFSSESALHIS